MVPASTGGVPGGTVTVGFVKSTLPEMLYLISER